MQGRPGSSVFSLPSTTEIRRGEPDLDASMVALQGRNRVHPAQGRVSIRALA